MKINVPLDLIEANPWQTRAVVEGHDATIPELAEDIAKNGLLQTPVGRLVRNKRSGLYKVVEGKSGRQALVHVSGMAAA